MPLSLSERFLPYPKLRESSPSHPGGEWLALEKVHGANLALLTDGREALPAKRRALLSPEEMGDFFRLHTLWPELRVRALEAGRALQLSQGESLILYGELCGGAYPHPQVPPVAGLQAVQGDLHYHPQLRWLAFDALLEQGGKRRWLAFREMESLLHPLGLECVPVLARGRPERLRELSLERASLLPARWGLPPLSEERAEGVVLRPSASQPWGEEKAGEKRKHPRFSENKLAGELRPPPKGEHSLSGWLSEQASARLTPARAQAARSKLGCLEDERVGEEMVADILEELSEQVGPLPSQLEGELRSGLRAGARALMETQSSPGE